MVCASDGPQSRLVRSRTMRCLCIRPRDTNNQTSFTGTKLYWYCVCAFQHRYERYNQCETPLRLAMDLDSGECPMEDVFFLRAHSRQTLMIPAGWIHAVFSPVDCLVFGGNFLHDYSILTQVIIVLVSRILAATKMICDVLLRACAAQGCVH